MKTRFNDTIEQKELNDAVNKGIESGDIGNDLVIIQGHFIDIDNYEHILLSWCTNYQENGVYEYLIGYCQNQTEEIEIDYTDEENWSIKVNGSSIELDSAYIEVIKLSSGELIFTLEQ